MERFILRILLLVVITVDIFVPHLSFLTSPLQISGPSSDEALLRYSPDNTSFNYQLPYTYRFHTHYNMANSPAKEKADPMVGKAGVGESNAPTQQTGTEQRPGGYLYHSSSFLNPVSSWGLSQPRLSGYLWSMYGSMRLIWN
jgi:hypothetical protein